MANHRHLLPVRSFRPGERPREQLAAALEGDVAVPAAAPAAATLAAAPAAAIDALLGRAAVCYRSLSMQCVAAREPAAMVLAVKHSARRAWQATPRAVALSSAVAGALVAGCQEEVSDLDGVFYNGDGRLVHCGVNLDTTANNSVASVDSGLDRARGRGEIVELYAHHPGVTVPIAKIEHVLAGARDRGLQFVTYSDFARGNAASPGLALSFDDTSVDAWVALRPLFQQYSARVTFFVSRYRRLSDEQHAGLKLLAADGHDVEPHTVLHLRAPDYVDSHGINAYLHDEVDPSIEVMRNDGYEIHAFAYPFGARTEELDRAIAERVPVIRSVAFSYLGVESPCPH